MKEGKKAPLSASEASFVTLDPVEMKKPPLTLLRSFSEQFSGQWQRPKSENKAKSPKSEAPCG